MIGYDWRIAAASVIGTSHLRSALSCQDNHACDIFVDSDGRQVLAVVASDGAGSAARSQEGSYIACRIIQQALRAYLTSTGGLGDLSCRTARQWVGLVQDAIADRAREQGEALRNYACTLLAAFIGENVAAFLQIGDGAMVVAADEPGEWTWVYWPQSGEFANTTYFVTDNNAMDNLQFDVRNSLVYEIAMFTDGLQSLVLDYSARIVHSPFFDRIFVPVRASLLSGCDYKLSNALKEYLAAPRVCERTDDDKTLILATRRAPPIAITQERPQGQ